MNLQPDIIQLLNKSNFSQENLSDVDDTRERMGSGDVDPYGLILSAHIRRIVEFYKNIYSIRAESCSSIFIVIIRDSRISES